jgi:hypothetical protein
MVAANRASLQISVRSSMFSSAVRTSRPPCSALPKPRAPRSRPIQQQQRPRALCWLRPCCTPTSPLTLSPHSAHISHLTHHALASSPDLLRAWLRGQPSGTVAGKAVPDGQSGGHSLCWELRSSLSESGLLPRTGAQGAALSANCCRRTSHLSSSVLGCQGSS